MKYRRLKIAGATYFFTVNTYNRKRILCYPENAKLLREAIQHTINSHPVKIDAIVLLPDHLHCIWTLPKEDSNYSIRWQLIKKYFSRHCDNKYEGTISKSGRSKGERGFWQRRYWEHMIRDDNDFIKHVEYIHYNPVKHGLVSSPKEWEYSSFHKFVKLGLYDELWGSGEIIQFESNIGNE